jgi:hypothetical protein
VEAFGSTCDGFIYGGRQSDDSGTSTLPNKIVMVCNAPSCEGWMGFVNVGIHTSHHVNSIHFTAPNSIPKIISCKVADVNKHHWDRHGYYTDYYCEIDTRGDKNIDASVESKCTYDGLNDLISCDLTVQGSVSESRLIGDKAILNRYLGFTSWYTKRFMCDYLNVCKAELTNTDILKYL